MQTPSLPVRSPEELTDEFHALAERWREETWLLSSLRDIVLDEHDQPIIGLGPAAAPLILGEFAKRPDHWMWALHAITGEDPAKGQGALAGAASTWLDWGRARGYLA